MKKTRRKKAVRKLKLKGGALKRKVCFVITSFIHYSRNLFVLEELKNHPGVELHILIGGTALLSKYSSKFAHILEILKRDGYRNIYELHFNVEGSDHIAKAKTVGLGITEFSTYFNHIRPDVVVVRGDRFEVLAAAAAAASMNIPVAHIEGGDLSGTLDESIRHSITKLSHIHFTTNDEARKRVIRMGEDPNYVFNFGSPDIEVVSRIVNGKTRADLSKTGSGADFDFTKPYLMVMFHPVSTEVDHIREQTRLLASAIHELGVPTLWFWPNFDAGAEELSHELRTFRDEVPNIKIRFMRYLAPKDFISLLKNTSCLVGNSSAGIKESSLLGIPVVNIGSRQQNRLRGKNVVDVDYHGEKIKDTITKQLKVGRYPKSSLYEGKDTSKRIAGILATVKLYVQKKFVE